jgi:hypothetical protein
MLSDPISDYALKLMDLSCGLEPCPSPPSVTAVPVCVLASLDVDRLLPIPPGFLECE